MEKRKFQREAVIFYDLEDYLVYYTVFCVLAVKYGIIVYGLCLMIDHIHFSCNLGLCQRI